MNPEFYSVRWYFRRSPAATGAFIVIAGVIAFTLSRFIVDEDFVGMAYAAMIAAGAAAIVAILRNWRNGLYFFLGWLMFEDLARKYLGNNMAITFGKDVLLCVVYLSFFLAYRRRETQHFRPPFLVPLLIFFWFGVLQVFNPASPSLFYGLLGMKVYFLYVPLVFIGYSLVQTEQDVRQFFKFCLAIAIVIASLGIVQAVMGHTFLNPTVIQEDIRGLSENYRTAPISGALLYRPNSVFVSTGRFMFYMFPAWLLSFGFEGYLFLRDRSRGAIALATAALGLCSIAVVMGGSRGALVWTISSAIIGSTALIWGAPWKEGKGLKVTRALQRALIVGGLAVGLMITFYPEAVASRFEFYFETLLSAGPQNELAYRTQTYPWINFLLAFDYPGWELGHGIGTASLGIQYITRILGVPQLGMGAESGYGVLVIELGIGGLILWLAMTTAIVVTAFKAVLKLRGTVWFPIGFVIAWFAFLLLFPQTFSGVQPYQDYLLNAHLWLLLGILFRLPTIPLSDRFNFKSSKLRAESL
ncbi:MAG TPA: hypothetical protein VN982_09020 [Candidatus Dormibacteraeota bacterium]|nr:hypothetical protein [Candidatus Dormibacteraeota bacterium]